MKKPLLVLVFLCHIAMFSQEKTNPIVFIEVFGGYSVGSSKGLAGGIDFNYQSRDNLFTFRYLGLSDLRYEGRFFFVPIYISVENIEELAVMYGKRTILDNHSFSYSAGIALVDRETLINYDGSIATYESQKSIGLPFELNVNWFKSKRKKYRIYGVIPIGKPTSFGNSFGFKIFGNVSKSTFVGVGISLGLGWYKNY
jgi:hypothetical protein